MEAERAPQDLVRGALAGAGGLVLASLPLALRIAAGGPLFMASSSALVWLALYSVMGRVSGRVPLLRATMATALYVGPGSLLYVSLLTGLWPGIYVPPPSTAAGVTLVLVVLLAWPMFLMFLLHGGPE